MRHCNSFTPTTNAGKPHDTPASVTRGEPSPVAAPFQASTHTSVPKSRSHGATTSPLPCQSECPVDVWCPIPNVPLCSNLVDDALAPEGTDGATAQLVGVAIDYHCCLQPQCSTYFFCPFLARSAAPAWLPPTSKVRICIWLRSHVISSLRALTSGVSFDVALEVA